MIDKNDARAILIIFLVLFIIVLVSILLFFATPKNLNINKNINESQVIDFTECLNDSSKEYCVSNNYVKDKPVEINYKKMKVAFANEKLVGASLYLNNTPILLPDVLAFRLENKIYLNDNTIVFAIYEASAKNIRLYVKNHKGELLKEIYEIDKQHDIIVTDFNVEKNKLTITGTKYIKRGSVVLTLEDDTRYVFKNASICEEVEANKLLSDSDLYQAQYEVLFSPRNIFKEIKIIPGTEILLGEYLKSLGCNE